MSRRDGLIVTRDVATADIRWVGFDLDHTLAVYDDDAVNSLACDETAALLVNDFGFPEALLDATYSGTEFVRGLVLDPANGALLKLDGEQRVDRAMRLGRWLDAPAIAAAYHNRLFDVRTTPKVFNSHFDLPTAFLFARATHAWDDAGARPWDYKRVCMTIRRALDCVHTCGRFKPAVRAHIDRYVRRQDGLSDRLARLRSAGKSLFVVTNSSTEYTVALLDHIIGRDEWPRLFDIIVTSADKPGFFDENGSARMEQASLRGVAFVEGGHVNALASRLDAPASSVLYIGDNPRADLQAPREIGWRTSAVIAELEKAGLEATPSEAGWDSPLSSGDSTSWFGSRVLEFSDIIAPRVGPIVDILATRETLSANAHDQCFS